MLTAEASQKATIEVANDGKQLVCHGDWTVSCINNKVNANVSVLIKKNPNLQCIDGSHIQQMDTAGALFIQDLLSQLRSHGKEIQLMGFSEKQMALFKLIVDEIEALHQSFQLPPPKNTFYKIGVWAIEKYKQALYFLSFIGELIIIFFKKISNFKLIHAESIVNTMDNNGYKALGILALMSFLIGIVLVYQLGLQLKNYGASIYIVDLTGIAILREFAPLIAAVIMAGRTSTSFAAAIGTMKVNEEIDALRTMGISPIERLVIPRIIGLLIVLPLLTVWSDIFGVFGGMVMAKSMIEINFYSFIERFREVVALKQYVLGLVKAPVFACIIAGVGCFQGFQVGSSAESVGVQTTKAAVQSIFLIIIADALFSVLFSWMGL